MARPVRLVQEKPHLGGGRYSVDPRCAWLLQVNRLAHVPDVSRKKFAELVSAKGFPADEWKLNRWESGEGVVGLAAAAAYEAVFSPDGHELTATVAFLRGSPMSTSQPGQDRALSPLSSHDFDAAFERLLDASGTGLDWYNVLVDPRISAGVYLPPRVWKDLTRALSAELTRSVGPALMFRKRAANLLIGQGRAHVLEGFREFLEAASCQALASAALHLTNARDPGFNELTVETLHHPDPAGRWGAMHTVAAKLALGHFSRSEVLRIEPEVVAAIGRGPLHDGGEALLRTLPEESRLRISGAVRNGHLLLRTRGAPESPARQARQLVRLMAKRARDAVAIEALREDTTVEALLTEALLHPHFEGRETARLTLMASPYRTHLVDAALDLLLEVPAAQQRRLGELIAFLSGSSHVPRLVELAASEQGPLLRTYALLALGRVRGPLPGEARRVIVDALAGPPSVASRGAVYALGMQGLIGDEEEGIVLPDDPVLRRCWRQQGTAIWS